MIKTQVEKLCSKAVDGYYSDSILPIEHEQSLGYAARYKHLLRNANIVEKNQNICINYEGQEYCIGIERPNVIDLPNEHEIKRISEDELDTNDILYLDNLLVFEKGIKAELISDSDYIFRLGIKVFTMGYHEGYCVGPEIVYKLGNVYYHASDYFQPDAGTGIFGLYFSLRDVLIQSELTPIYSGIKSIESTEMNSREITLLCHPYHDVDDDFTVLVNNEVWGFSDDIKDRDFVCLKAS